MEMFTLSSMQITTRNRLSKFFTTIDMDPIGKLRSLLRQRDVYLAKRRKVILSQALYQLLESDSWPEKDRKSQH